MDLNEHEIWDRPVESSDAPVEPERRVEPVTSGRLYAAAGVTGHPDAIVALPHYTRNFVSVAELPDVVAETPPPPPAPQAPIIQDPAIAEVLAPAVAPSGEREQLPSFDWAKSIEVQADPEDLFKDWYVEPTPAPTHISAPVKTGRSAQQMTDAALRARTQLQDIGERVTSGSYDIRKYSLIAFLFSAVVGIVDAFVAGTLGLPFGVALVASTTFGAFKLERDDVWVGWVMPAYIAIAAILVGGQFADGAPGFSIVGQVLLVGTTLITIAPWLAIATVIGVLLPRVRKR